MKVKLFGEHKQLLVFMAQALLMATCDMVDTAFGNNLGVDAICVAGSMSSIIGIVFCLYNLGRYAHTILLDDDKICFCVNVAVSVVISLVLFVLSDKLPYLFRLTESQYILFERCLRIYAVGVPLRATADFLSYYMTVKYMNTLMLISNIMFYTILIASDAICLFAGGDLGHMLIATNVTHLVYDCLVVAASKILKQQSCFSLAKIKEVLYYGYSITIDKLMTRLSTFIYTSCASRLGQDIYAVHAVCSMAKSYGERMFPSMFTYQNVQLHKVNNKNEKYNKCKQIYKDVITDYVLIRLCWHLLYCLFCVVKFLLLDVLVGYLCMCYLMQVLFYKKA